MRFRRTYWTVMPRYIVYFKCYEYIKYLCTLFVYAVPNCWNSVHTNIFIYIFIKLVNIIIFLKITINHIFKKKYIFICIIILKYIRINYLKFSVPSKCNFMLNYYYYYLYLKSKIEFSKIKAKLYIVFFFLDYLDNFFWIMSMNILWGGHNVF